VQYLAPPDKFLEGLWPGSPPPGICTHDPESKQHRTHPPSLDYRVNVVPNITLLLMCYPMGDAIITFTQRVPVATHYGDGKAFGNGR